MRRKRVPVSPEPPADLIGDSVDRVEARSHERTLVRLPVMTQPHAWPIDADVTVVAPDSPKDPLLLLWDPVEAGWRVIVLPPGSAWRIRNAATNPTVRERLSRWLRQRGPS